MSVRLYIGNLSKELQREEFEQVFAEHADDLVSVKLISDKKTGKCRGFGFVTVKTDEFADTLVEKYNGYMLQESPLKVEKALPRSKGAENNDGGGNRRSNSGGGKRGGKRGGGNTTMGQHYIMQMVVIATSLINRRFNF